ncbi:ankyrin repeat and BTB/POZ domain-containing protein 1-like [Octopus sinensis]|uniref:Ankyrin repeat and BTB/POZ domain-containing protein 1-like n=1 Tax=Octopus sinensis TaxID=2607531 RepID=A0A6P7SEV3_9MOLL|nr:ankyrin repeat and BTB/POZ domain-containing protein 1-like [Octopus sinensis]XP_036358953.1 ankyrin repeat and BTB/POZ domain-containing protein 1-like [Octopus sinensis]
MDVEQLFLSCRIGDLKTVEYLVDEKDVEINIHDKWDSTPLYYACLCGHIDVVYFLLTRGAKCERNTFDGERCLYGALNNEIRNLLKSFKVITAKILQRNIFDEYLQRLQEDITFSDIIFYVHGVRFSAHKAVLSSRCSYFAELFNTKWKNKSEVNLNHQLIYPQAFKALLEHLYTDTSEIGVDYVDDYVRLARHCKLDALEDAVSRNLRKLYSYVSSKPCIKITTITVECESVTQNLQTDFLKLANATQPHELGSWPIRELPFDPEYPSMFADIGFIVEGYRFLGHKCILSTRTDYFKVLLTDHFNESENSEGIPFLSLHEVSALVFRQIMYFIYTDSCEISESNVSDVLYTADIYLLPGLKRQCANFMSKNLEVQQVVSVLRIARLFNLYRLQNQCAEYMATNLVKVIQLPDFAELVQEDAHSVKERQETDSIEIIDNVRYYLTNFVQTFSDLQETKEKLVLIDQLLEELDLNG